MFAIFNINPNKCVFIVKFFLSFYQRVEKLEIELGQNGFFAFVKVKSNLGHLFLKRGDLDRKTKQNKSN